MDGAQAHAEARRPRGLTFTVPGVPRPKARPRVVDGHAFTPTATRAHEGAIAMYARAATRQRFRGALAVRLLFVGANARADVDNLAKAVLDGLQLGGVIENDDQVVRLECDRVPSDGDPRTEIELRDVGQDLDLPDV